MPARKADEKDERKKDGALKMAADQAAKAGPALPDNKPRYAIEIKGVLLGIGAGWFIVGMVVAIYVSKNNNISPFDPTCTVMKGRMHSWLSYMGKVLMFYGFVGITMAGVIPMLFQFFELHDEAICLADLCMGCCGTVFQWFLFILLIVMNIYGSFILWRAYKPTYEHQRVQTVYPALRRSFCKKAFLDIVIVIMCLVWAVIVFQTALGIRNCFLACAYERSLGKNKYGPRGEDLEGQLGIKKEDTRGRYKEYKRQKKQRAKEKKKKKKARKKAKKPKKPKKPKKKVKRKDKEKDKKRDKNNKKKS